MSDLKILITGGSGFLGRAIVNELLDASSAIKKILITVFDIKDFPDERVNQIRFIKGDIRNYEEIKIACKDMDIIIHSAAIVDWGTKLEQEVYDVNYIGTKHVIRACKENNISMLVYTSSLDTVISGKPLVDIDESQPYPKVHPNMYCKSKYLAEKLVAEENSPSLRTCVLRPSDIYGEEDPYHIQPLINMAKGGFYIRIGNGSAKSQHVYVGNIAHAHVLAAKALIEKNSKVYGNTYFITDSPGTNFFTFFDTIVIGAGYRIWPKNLWLPRKVAYVLGTLSEYIALLIRPIKYYNPKLSRFAVLYTCTDFTFTAQKAQDDFGFLPKYSQEEAYARTAESFRKMSL
jgi:nucleoside-diphosphate-sugar epimerase